MKLNFNDIKKLIETDSTLVLKEIPEGLIIKRADGAADVDVEEIKVLLSKFGVKPADLEVVENGTIVRSKNYNSQKLKMLLAPFYKLGELVVIDEWALLLQDIFLMDVDDVVTEDADGSADDLGTVPTDGASNDTLDNIESIAALLDKQANGAVEVRIVADDTVEVPFSEDILDFIKNNENTIFANCDVEVTDEVITIRFKG